MIQISNILKVADIESNQLPPVFIKWLNKEITPIYNDNEGLKEHLFNIDTIIENQAESEGDDSRQYIWDILHQIETTLRSGDCSYFRIIY